VAVPRNNRRTKRVVHILPLVYRDMDIYDTLDSDEILAYESNRKDSKGMFDREYRDRGTQGL
jgi:hypothetical protein